jgi:signal transduction histidine kinase
MFITSSVAVALISGALGVGHHRGFAAMAGILGIVVLLAALAGVGRAIRGGAWPLSDVMEAADRVAAGDYEARVREAGFPEMRGLARSFNQMAQRLGSNEQRRRDLLADIAHELRTPLSVIQGHTEGMIDGLYPADAAHLEPLLEETKVMARLLDDLQTLSTAEAGALKLHREPTHPGQLVDEAVSAFRSAASTAGVTLQARVQEGLPLIDVDPVRMVEVLFNLMSNALRHTPSGGSITVQAESEGDARSLAFVVRDTGDGIPPEALPHVFERFVKGADSRGAGLGLAIARTLIEAHGGTIAAESSVGQGTTMRFVIPLKA